MIFMRVSHDIMLQQILMLSMNDKNDIKMNNDTSKIIVFIAIIISAMTSFNSTLLDSISSKFFITFNLCIFTKMYKQLVNIYFLCYIICLSCFVKC